MRMCTVDHGPWMAIGEYVLYYRASIMYVRMLGIQYIYSI